MKPTCAVVTVFLPFIAFTTSLSDAHLLIPSPLLLQLAATEPVNKSINRISFKTIVKGVRSGFRESSQTAIQTQAQWLDLWRKHTSISTNPAPPPTINFDKEIVAAVFLGEKPTGGYAVEIIAAELTDGSLNVFFQETAPTPGAIVTQSVTQPFDIVRIEVNGIGTVSFRRLP
jgi:hypothetical protein